MQIVPREVLFDVMSHRHPVKFKTLDETEPTNSSAFQSFMSNVDRIYTSNKGQMAKFIFDVQIFMLDNAQNLRYIAEGSSRAVYALSDGTVLKVAKSDAGIAQNKTEIRHCMNPKLKYQIFPDFYGADKDHWLALNCEMCAEANEEDFIRIFGVRPIDLTNVVEFIIDNRLDDWEFNKAEAHYKLQKMPAYAEFARRLSTSSNEAFSCVKSLVDFYRKNGLKSMLLGDIESPANWGLTFRNNEQVLVIIDAGFSQDVYDKYYT